MRKFFTGLVLAAALPLAACFDADITADFTDTDEVKLDAIMTMGAEIYQMASSMGEDPCEDGEGMENADGTYTCAMLERMPLDQLLAEMANPESELGMGGDGVTIEELGNGNLAVSFDLSEMTADLPSPEERAQMVAMFGDAFAGHAFTIRVVGDEIISTNGEVTGDGTTAELVIALEEMMKPVPDIPTSFDVEVKPGN